MRGLFGHPGRPLQQIAATSPRFARRARLEVARAARDGAPFDALHVEHLRGAVAIDMLRPLGVYTVFDAVDCLAELARLTAAHNPHPLYRRVARHEERRTARLEARLLEVADLVTVTAERDRRALLSGRELGHVITVPNGAVVRAEPVRLSTAPRAVFTGKLSYHANQAAARWLLEQVWPRVRARVPNAELTIAGAEPPQWLRERCRHSGIELSANPADLSAIVAQARVALAPIVYSVGIQNKVIEAMALGVPVVGTASAAAGLEHDGGQALGIADDPEGFAALVARLLVDEPAARRLGIAGYEYVRRRHSWSDVAGRFEELYRSSHAQAEAA
jgi:glycosyltransferase involved in cell wall biosynthesis